MSALAKTDPTAVEAVRAAVQEHVPEALQQALDAWVVDTTKRRRESSEARSDQSDAMSRQALAVALETAERSVNGALDGLEFEAVLLEAFEKPTGWKARQSLIGSLIATGLPKPEPLPGPLGIASRLLLKDKVAGFSGHPDSLKTSGAVACGIDYMMGGGRFVVADWENGETELAWKVLDTCRGIDPDRDWQPLLDERLLYLYMAGAEPDWEMARSAAAEYPDALWLWDSKRGIIRSYGGDENSAADVGRFYDPLNEFVQRGHAVGAIVLEHMAKKANADTRYSRGSGDSLAGVQVGWYFDATAAPDRSTSGRVELTRTKNRGGVLPPKQAFKVGDGNGSLTWTPDALDSANDAREKAIIAVLKAAGKPCSVEALRQAKNDKGIKRVAGDHKVIKAACERLAETPGRPVRQVGDRYEYVAGDDNEALDF